MSAPGLQSARLYVGGVAPNIQQKEVEDLFGKFGKILEIRLNRNFAFVQFSEDAEAQAAIQEVNGTNHWGRRLDVQLARIPKGGMGGPNDMGMNRDGRDRSPIRGGPGGPGRGGMAGRGGFGPPGRGMGDRGGMDRGPPFRDGPGGRFNDEQGFGGRGGSGDFRGPPDFRGGRDDYKDYPPRLDGPSPFPGRDREGSNLFGPSGGRDFSLAPPTGFRGDSGPPNKFWGGGGDRGPSGLNEKAFDTRPRDIPPFQPAPERPPTHPVEPASVPNTERTNDIEIIIVDKSLTEYGEMIERRMSNLGFSVDVLFPHEAVPLARVLANIASRGTLYAVVITHVHQINGSLTFHILHGRPQEHRNMAIDDAITLLLRNYEAYTRSCREKSAPNTPPEQIRHLMTQVLNGKSLTTTQYDILVQFLIQEKLKLDAPPDNAGLRDNQSTTAQAELQTRILSILNKNAGGGESIQKPVPPPIQQPGPLLQDPSIQKALDSLMQGGDLLRQIQPQSAPFGRF